MSRIHSRPNLQKKDQKLKPLYIITKRNLLKIYCILLVNIISTVVIFYEREWLGLAVDEFSELLSNSYLLILFQTVSKFNSAQHQRHLK